MKITRERIQRPSRADAEAKARAEAQARPQAEERVPAEPQDASPESKRLARVTEFMKSFMLTTQDLDLFILKSHVLIEHELRRLLAHRLGLTDPEFNTFEERTKNLGSYHLANIALAGDENKDLLTAMSKLNDVRVEIAHRMDPNAYEKKLNDLNDVIWGGADRTPADTRLATLTSLSNLWSRIVRSYLDARYGEGTFERVMP